MTTLLAELYVDKALELIDMKTGKLLENYYSVERIDEKTGKPLENIYGSKVSGHYDNLIGISRVAVRAREGVPEMGAETVDFVITKMPEPMSAHGQAAVEGGRIYSNVVYRTINRFMEDSLRAVGLNPNTEKFWREFNEDMTAQQKGVKEWIGFGEK
jgi:hypothetical protein